MVIGVLQVELSIGGAQSIKDKRRVVASLKDRLHRQHQVSVAEVAALEDHHVAILGIALASKDVRYCRGVLDRVLGLIHSHRGCVLSDHTTEILTGH